MRLGPSTEIGIARSGSHLATLNEATKGPVASSVRLVS